MNKPPVTPDLPRPLAPAGARAADPGWRDQARVLDVGHPELGAGRGAFAPAVREGYVFRRSGPAVRSDEVELRRVYAAELAILWGQDVLQVDHRVLPASFHVGEEVERGETCDFFLPAEKIGARRMPVFVSRGERLEVVVPPGAAVELEAADGSPVAALELSQRRRPCAEVEGAFALELAAGERARVRLSDLTFCVSKVRAGKPMRHGLGSGVDATVLAYFGLSALSLGGLISSMAYLVPPLGLLDDEATDEDRLYLIQQYLEAASLRETELEERAEAIAEEVLPSGRDGGSAPGESGAAGKPEAAPSRGRLAVRDNGSTDPVLARQRALEEARTFGMIGVLASAELGGLDGPTSPFGALTESGLDSVTQMGALFGTDPAENRGVLGLGLSGLGERAGGKTEGVGLGGVRTLGLGNGSGDPGFGSDHGRMRREHRPSGAPVLRTGATQVSGRLPKHSIQRVVRQNHGRFRRCYEDGLRENPSLEGRVNVRFVIGREGFVTAASSAGSDLPNVGVVRCVTRAFESLKFPVPEHGTVRVTYPLMLQPE